VVRQHIVLSHRPITFSAAGTPPVSTRLPNLALFFFRDFPQLSSQLVFSLVLPPYYLPHPAPRAVATVVLALTWHQPGC
jgi:hypothetical protein